MIPYFCVGLAYLPFKLLLSSFANKAYAIEDFWKIVIGVNPDGELWFLYVLFVISVLYCLVRNHISRGLLSVSFIGLLCGVYVSMPRELSSVLWFQFYYALGIYCRNEGKRLWEFCRSQTISSILALAVFAGCNGILMAGAEDVAPLCRILTSISGSYVLICIADWLGKRQTGMIAAVETLGVYCMDIYILSDIIKIPFRILLWSKLHLYFPAFAVCLVMGIGLSYLISKYVIRKNKWLRRLILGMD